MTMQTELKTYPNLFRFAKEIDDEWSARGSINWQEAEDLVQMVINMDETDRNGVSTVLEEASEDDWDSEEVGRWPALVADYLAETSAGINKDAVDDYWKINDVRLSGGKEWIANVASEAVADSLMGLYQ